MKRLVLIILALAVANAALAWVPTPVKEDPLVRMPGSQPAPEGNVSIEAPGRCLNCHSGYNPSVEPGTNWMGSMMAQAARDFLFYACMTTAAQDSIWAVGTPNATDICARCHFPKGWLEGRSDPTNATNMVGADFDGVQCDFCHTSFDPFYDSTFDGSREGNDPAYWDETNASNTPSDSAALSCWEADQQQAAGIQLFDGSNFFINDAPSSGNYDENGSGQYFVSTDAAKRASFADAAARHQMEYSRYHKSKYFCGTCHDVSNPVLANLEEVGDPNLLTTEEFAAYSYYHVERTFSEFMLSDYGQQGGAPGIGPFDPAVFNTSFSNNYIARCQDCHMRDVVGTACNKKGVPIRPNDSVEHPESGQPLHDLTGGNAWVSWVLASATPGSPNYDSFNDAELNQGPAVLTLDLSQGLGIDPVALLAGVDRAKQQLELAAAIENVSLSNGSLSFRVQNQTGHKLISGFPEGRRMFLNIKGYDAAGALVYEVNPYDGPAGTLKGLHDASYYDGEGLPDPQPLAAGEVYMDELVYEAHPTSSLTGEEHTFHFALATDRYKDNRIPPRGFRIAEAGARLSVPVWHGAEDPNYFTAAEYAGGYDEVAVSVPTEVTAVEINLYYQTTSREYIEFLRNEIRGTGNLTLPGDGAGGDPAYIVQTDPFFDQLRAWGDTIWNLWTYNMNVDGAAPYLMATAAIGDTGGGGCEAPIPTMLTATPSHQQVTIDWSDEHGGDPAVSGYYVYYDQADKGQYVAQVGLTTSYTDTNLTNGQQYCYKVTSYHDAQCESDFSNILCATPSNQIQSDIAVTTLETGVWTGKGKNRQFVLTSSFTRGDSIVMQGYVEDVATGQPVADALVDIQITGPESAQLTSGPSAADGMFEVTWNTQAPNKRGQGGTAPGGYTATVAGVIADGYVWDGVATSATFTLD